MPFGTLMMVNSSEHKMFLWLTDDPLLRRVPLKDVALSDSKIKKKEGREKNNGGSG